LSLKRSTVGIQAIGNRLVNLHTCIAVAQTRAAAGDVAANIEEHLSLAQLAAAEGSFVVVFPELSLTGYELEQAPRLAFQPRDPRLNSLCDAARQWQTTLLVGAPIATHGKLHIGTFVLKPDGEIDLYTKRRLGAFPEAARVDGIPPPPEATFFQPGSADPLVAVGQYSASLAICADIGDPDHAQAAARRGASMYLASMFVIPSDYRQDAARLAAYAAEHELVVAMANYGAPTGGLNAAGGSAIWNSSGECLVQLPSSGSGVAVAAETADGWQTAVRMLDVEAGRGAEHSAIGRVRETLVSAVNRSDAEAASQLWTEDSRMMPPNQPTLQGRAAIHAHFARLFTQRQFQYTLSNCELQVFGDMAVERVEYHVITRSIADGSVAEDCGKGLHVYRRDSDGRWRLYADIWNSDRGTAGLPGGGRRNVDR
jgi:uncharacterized protein (TIGR02246 family)